MNHSRPHWESGLFVVAALGVCLFSGFSSSGLASWQIVLLAAGVALFGLPHGALDPWIARRSDLPLPAWAFGLTYLAMALAVIALWWWQPALTLALFLLISAWHFSGDWQPDLPLWARLAVGLSLLALPIWSHPQTVQFLFGLLSGPGGERLAEQLAAPAVLAVPAMASAGLWLLVTGRRRAAAELLALLLLGWLTTPLLYFIVYFCLLHSPRHLLTERWMTPPHLRGKMMTSGLLNTGLTIVLAVPFALWLSQTGDIEQTLLRVVFIGLAALTVPHMALIFWVKHSEKA